jgi:hypothetical protein
MPGKDIQKALELLKEARKLLKESDCENLKISTNYLNDSIEWLALHRRGSGPKG